MTRVSDCVCVCVCVHNPFTGKQIDSVSFHSIHLFVHESMCMCLCHHQSHCMTCPFPCHWKTITSTADPRCDCFHGCYHRGSCAEFSHAAATGATNGSARPGVQVPSVCVAVRSAYQALHSGKSLRDTAHRHRVERCISYQAAAFLYQSWRVRQKFYCSPCTRFARKANIILLTGRDSRTLCRGSLPSQE